MNKEDYKKLTEKELEFLIEFSADNVNFGSNLVNYQRLHELKQEYAFRLDRNTQLRFPF